jgi:hypothetical protein
MSMRRSTPGAASRGALAAGLAAGLLICGCATQHVQSPGLHEGNRAVEYRLDAELYNAKNGLRVLLLPDASTNLVRVDVRYQTGAGFDPPGKRGLAHLSEHVSFTLETLYGVAHPYARRLWSADSLKLLSTGDLERFRDLHHRIGSTTLIAAGRFDAAAFEAERAAEALPLMRETLRHLREAAFAADFVRARRQVVQRLLADALSSSNVADELEYIASNQLPLDYFEQLSRRVAALRMDEVRALMAAELSASSEVVIASGQRASIAAMYRAAGIESYRTIDSEP